MKYKKEEVETTLDAYLESIKDTIDKRKEGILGLPKRLRDLRLKEGGKGKYPYKIRVTDVSKMLNISISMAGRYEMNSEEEIVIPNVYYLVTLATFYGVTLDYLIYGREDVSENDGTIYDEADNESIDITSCKKKLDECRGKLDSYKKVIKDLQ